MEEPDGIGMKSLEDQWEKLKLSDEERRVVDVGEDNEEEAWEYGERSIVGKIFLDRTIGRETLSATMRKIWRISKPAEFREVGDNKFVISFSSVADKLRVLDGRPWLFDNHLFVLKAFEAFTQPNEWKFESELFWIQIHNLPMICMTKEKGNVIGKSLGRLMKVDVPNDGIGWGEFLRVRVEIPLKRAVVRGRWLMVNGHKVWVDIKYEKLPRLCFKCGWLIHGEKGCLRKKDEEDGVGKTEQDQFGSWLRADGGQKRRYQKGGWEERSGTGADYFGDSKKGEASESHADTEGKNSKGLDAEESESSVVGVRNVGEGGFRERCMKEQAMVEVQNEEERVGNDWPRKGKDEIPENMGKGILVKKTPKMPLGVPEMVCGEIVSEERKKLKGKKSWKRRAREFGKIENYERYPVRGKRGIEMEGEGGGFKKQRQALKEINSPMLLAGAAGQPCQEL
ncbi:hypothetical protein F2P56_006537 [Juglans regia]|uniref:DUF4283 domain-containing protein n=2 Tax=Juglans regia TaxID=51240 RepID=A0A834CYF5_JUGRE|nr:uncharacterized protein LOC108979333 [Juglans regia]KAF5474654.1 hypothetical protein F2P56_006537 [Juglans regia]